MPVDIRTLLNKVTYRAIDVEQLLDPNRPSWIKFDAELGYVPDDITMQDGMDFSRSTYTHEPAGQRKMVNYAERPCRINTYGNSFTQCQQVSDDETWQERLAAHIGEPIRNFGCGGHGVNQCALRAMRMEQTECSAEYVILNIFDDDHFRNLDAARWIRTAWHEQSREEHKAYPLHGLPWAHVRWDLDRGAFVDRPSLCKTADDLRALCDKDHFYGVFKDDTIVRLFTLRLGGVPDEAAVEELSALAEVFGVEIDFNDPNARWAGAERLHVAYALKSTEYILDKLRSWLDDQGKKLMVLLSYSEGRIPLYIRHEPRFDQPLLDYLERNNLATIDFLGKHAEDFKMYNLSLEDYIARYYIQPAGAAVFGHYNPLGNLFCAFSMKNELVDWLDPKPPAYRD